MHKIWLAFAEPGCYADPREYPMDAALLEMMAGLPPATQRTWMALAIPGLWDLPPGEQESRLRAKLAAIDLEPWRGKIIAGLVRECRLEQAVPERHAAFRPVVEDGVTFLLERLPLARLHDLLVAQWLLPPDSSPAERLVALAAGLPTLWKLGQMIARRPGLDPALGKLLRRLEDGIRQTDAAVVRRRVEDGLGPWADVYEFEIAAAVLAEGRVGVVLPVRWRRRGSGEPWQEAVAKLVKPEAARRLPEEIAWLGEVARQLQARQAGYAIGTVDFEGLFREVRDGLARELDLAGEQGHLREAAAFFAGRAPGAVPAVLPFSTPEMTVMTRLPGGKVAGRRPPPATGNPELARRGDGDDQVRLPPAAGESPVDEGNQGMERAGVERMGLPSPVSGAGHVAESPGGRPDGWPPRLQAAVGSRSAESGLAAHLFRLLILEPLFDRGEVTVFHGDPHAGNILCDAQGPGGHRWGFLDWSQTGRLTRPQREALVQVAMAVMIDDPGRATTFLRRLAAPPEGIPSAAGENFDQPAPADGEGEAVAGRGGGERLGTAGPVGVGPIFPADGRMTAPTLDVALVSAVLAESGPGRASRGPGSPEGKNDAVEGGPAPPEKRRSSWLGRAVDVVDGLLRRGVAFPRDLLLFRKSLFTLEGVLADLDPDFDADAELGRYLVGLLLDELPGRWLDLTTPWWDHPARYRSLLSNLDLQAVATCLGRSVWQQIWPGLARPLAPRDGRSCGGPTAT